MRGRTNYDKITSLYLGNVKPEGYKRKSCSVYVYFGFVNNNPFIEYEIWRSGKGSVFSSGNNLAEIDHLIEGKYDRKYLEDLMKFNMENLTGKTLKEFKEYFENIVFQRKYSGKVLFIIKDSGNEENKKLIKNGNWEMFKTETWNDKHKIIYVSKLLSDKKGCFVDIETKEIFE